MRSSPTALSRYIDNRSTPVVLPTSLSSSARSSISEDDGQQSSDHPSRAPSSIADIVQRVNSFVNLTSEEIELLSRTPSKIGGRKHQNHNNADNDSNTLNRNSNNRNHSQSSGGYQTAPRRQSHHFRIPSVQVDPPSSDRPSSLPSHRIEGDGGMG